jgi:hypothetical protein
MDVKWVELVIFIALFALVSGHGLHRPRGGAKAKSLEHLDEWGLGGRNFGRWISWFLLGGDLYTAYTFVAVPALLFGAARSASSRSRTRSRLPDGVHGRAAAVVGRAPPRLRHAGRLRPRAATARRRSRS